MAQQILLRSVYGKVGMVYTINPCPDKKTGRFCKWVKKVDSKGDMIITDAEKNSPDFPYFIPENREFKVSDGQVFDLDNPYDLAEWEAIKNAPIIATSRYEKDANGNYVIDGNTRDTSTHPRNGVAELYVDIPGIETEARVKKSELVYKASKFIFEDSDAGRLKITKMMGKYMENAPSSDITEFLLEAAKRNPNRIIKLYTSDDAAYRLLFIDAKDKHIINLKNGMYLYGDDIILGATDDAVVTYFLNKDNKKVVEMIKKDTYPEMYKEDTKKK